MCVYPCTGILEWQIESPEWKNKALERGTHFGGAARQREQGVKLFQVQLNNKTKDKASRD